ncbi:hypothetical protein G7077_09255 [Sphingomonas piscis]|uniref:Uncharacterized protein n=1 Tax=Sphingomonas piscis TaxID=2714943 RepID=A0A6G7YQN3_9SPHN|nr:hypothetical protein [Sphingomonas piscis]QIK79051.1 hypothetical protein G7077_09255 [Sphingomonas piscis]
MTVNDNHPDAGEMERLGVVRVQTESFLWGGFRYGTAREAMAAARRGPSK